MVLKSPGKLISRKTQREIVRGRSYLERQDTLHEISSAHLPVDMMRILTHDPQMNHEALAGVLME